MWREPQNKRFTSLYCFFVVIVFHFRRSHIFLFCVIWLNIRHCSVYGRILYFTIFFSLLLLFLFSRKAYKFGVCVCVVFATFTYCLWHIAAVAIVSFATFNVIWHKQVILYINIYTKKIFVFYFIYLFWFLTLLCHRCNGTLKKC